jgi:hypothetical protein
MSFLATSNKLEVLRSLVGYHSSVYHLSIKIRQTAYSHHGGTLWKMRRVTPTSLLDYDGPAGSRRCSDPMLVLDATGNWK